MPSRHSTRPTATLLAPGPKGAEKLTHEGLVLGVALLETVGRTLTWVAARFTGFTRLLLVTWRTGLVTRRTGTAIAPPLTATVDHFVQHGHPFLGTAIGKAPSLIPHPVAHHVA